MRNYNEINEETDIEAEFADEHLEGLETVVAYLDEERRVHDLYALPIQPSVDEVYAAARASVDDMRDKGCFIPDPVVFRFNPVYR